MPKTVIEKCQSPSPDITVFSVSGTLGFHEKDTLVKLFSECKKRKLAHVIFNVEGLTSLGGGCANIIREEAAAGEISIGIAHAKSTVLRFLKDDCRRIVFSDSMDDMVSKMLDGSASEADTDAESSEAVAPAEPKEQADTSTVPPEGNEQDCDAVDDPREDLAGPAQEPSSEDTPATQESPAETEVAVGPAVVPDVELAKKTDPAAKELRKRILQYNTVFSLASDLYRINDRKSLLDLFLLTTIAQVGVESAVFLEFNEGYFTPVAVKGLEADELRGLAIAADQLNLDEWKDSREVFTVNSNQLPDEIKAPLLSIGCSYLAPFIARGHFRGILAMGRSVRPTLEAGTVEFLKILINQAAIAYESTQRRKEKDSRRGPDVDFSHRRKHSGPRQYESYLELRTPTRQEIALPG